MATVYLFCGLPGSGKTTFARDLERRLSAVRFTLDHRMLAKYELTIFDDEYGHLARTEKDAIWKEAQDALRSGRDVVLDWSLWSRKSRLEWTEKVVRSGHAYKLLFFQVPLSELKLRLAKRNSDASALAHEIPLDKLEDFSHVFEVPRMDEGIPFDVIASDG